MCLFYLWHARLKDYLIVCVLTGKNSLNARNVKENQRSNTHILHSVCIFLLVEVVVKSSHVRLFEIGLEGHKKKYVKRQEVSIFEHLDWNTKEVQLRDRNENRKTARWAEKLTDFDLARLPRVWIVLDMRVRVLEVAGSWGQERANKIKFSSRTRAQKSKAGMFKLGLLWIMK